ncbi:hypothetical protein DVH24_013492 [Malus domestica]|uniref:Uncharacterized protein n=1 Tax=Malus domestica TaxID=3750 RepID=A0A498HGZ3_MALDO|nr:hypothetical protein DVH24_013492 [Malus domestica]
MRSSMGAAMVMGKGCDGDGKRGGGEWVSEEKEKEKILSLKSLSPYKSASLNTEPKRETTTRTPTKRLGDPADPVVFGALSSFFFLLLCRKTMGFVSFLGRVLFASIFILSAWQAFNEFGVDGGPAAKDLAPKFNVFKKNLSAKLGVAIPEIEVRHLAAGVVAMKGLGGLLFVLNSSFGASLLLLQLAITTPLIYDFYNCSPENAKFGILLNEFLQHAALFGALLFFIGMKNSIPNRQVKKKAAPKTKTELRAVVLIGIGFFFLFLVPAHFPSPSMLSARSTPPVSPFAFDFTIMWPIPQSPVYSILLDSFPFIIFLSWPVYSILLDSFPSSIIFLSWLHHLSLHFRLRTTSTNCVLSRIFARVCRALARVSTPPPLLALVGPCWSLSLLTLVGDVVNGFFLPACFLISWQLFQCQSLEDDVIFVLTNYGFLDGLISGDRGGWSIVMIMMWLFGGGIVYSIRN